MWEAPAGHRRHRGPTRPARVEQQLQAPVALRVASTRSLLLGCLTIGSARALLHGADNNWLVEVSGPRDAAGCMRVDAIVDVSRRNIAPDDGLVCVGSSHTCVDGGYEPGSITRPRVGGCEFDEATATESTTVRGYLMDHLCYNNVSLSLSLPPSLPPSLALSLSLPLSLVMMAADSL